MKRIIAREFLFVLGFGVLVGLIYCTLLFMQYAKKLKVEELSRQSIILKDFQPSKYCDSFSEGNTSAYDDFKELYFDLRSYGITDIDESEFDIFAKLNCRDYRILQLYNALEDEYDLGSIEDFTGYLQDESKRKMFYEQVIFPRYNVESLQQFESVYGLGVKSEEQVLKDFIATVQKNDYNYGVVMPKFPELKDIDLQVLKDYVATAEANNYDYSIINPKFPELVFGVKKEKDSKVTSQMEGKASPTQVNDISKNDIKSLFQIIPKGKFSNEQELQDFIETEGVGAIYSAIPKGIFSSKKEFESTSYSAIKKRVLTFQYNQFSDFHTSAKIKLDNEIKRVRRKNPFKHFLILVVSLFSIVFLLRYLIYSTMWSVKQLKN